MMPRPVQPNKRRGCRKKRLARKKGESKAHPHKYGNHVVLWEKQIICNDAQGIKWERQG